MSIGRRAPITYNVYTLFLIYRCGINYPNNMRIQFNLQQKYITVKIRVSNAQCTLQNKLAMM